MKKQQQLSTKQERQLLGPLVNSGFSYGLIWIGVPFSTIA